MPRNLAARNPSAAARNRRQPIPYPDVSAFAFVWPCLQQAGLALPWPAFRRPKPAREGGGLAMRWIARLEDGDRERADGGGRSIRSGAHARGAFLLDFVDAFIAGRDSANVDGFPGNTLEDLVVFLNHYVSGC